MSLDGNSENLVAEYKFLEGKMSFTLDKWALSILWNSQKLVAPEKPEH